jgi:hypothetical protein
MSGHDDLGFDSDLGHGRDVLKQTIGALVDGATPSGVPSTPEENLGLLRRRVRTWRIAKAGAVGLTSAVVVGALAFSTAQASTWNRAEPLPGRPTIESTERGPVPSEIPTTLLPPSPTASPSPSPSPSSVAEVEPAPDASASSVATEPEPGTAASDGPEVAWPPFEPFDEGYLPWTYDAPPIGCGLPIGDLPAYPVRFTLEPNDSPADLRVTSGFTITEVAGESHELSSGVDPEYLLFQDGRLVGSSVGARDAGFWGTFQDRPSDDGYPDLYEETAPNQTWQVADSHTVIIDELSTCGERFEPDDPDVAPYPQYSTPFPAGEYDVVYAAPYRLVGSDSWELAYSASYPVTLS